MTTDQLALILADSRVTAIMSGPEETRHVELAKLLGSELCGFTADDEKYIDMFWDPVFNESWLYVTKEMVEHQMGYKPSKDMMKDFYVKLMKEYEADVDYKQITQDDPSVESHSGIFPINNQHGRGQQDGRGGANKKHYKITGSTFRDLAMSAQTLNGKRIRKYYCKVERLCVLTNKVLSILVIRENQRLAADNQRLAIEEKESARKADVAADGFATVFTKYMSLVHDIEQRVRELAQQEQELKQRALRLRQMELELELDRKRRERRTR